MDPHVLAPSLELKLHDTKTHDNKPHIYSYNRLIENTNNKLLHCTKKGKLIFLTIWYK